MNRRTVTIAGVIFVVGVAIAAALWWKTRPNRSPAVSAPAAGSAWDPMNPTHMAKRERITALLERAQTAPPTSAEAQEMFGLVLNDPAFNVRVRAMAVLPFVRERDRAIDVLLDALEDRDPETSGSGNVPLYATTYLADMNATRAVPAIEDWLAFLENQKPYGDEMRSMMVKKGKEDLARLKGGGTPGH
jgi:HEAT repeat protein